MKLPLLPLHQIVQQLHMSRRLLHLMYIVKGTTLLRTTTYFESQEKSQTLSEFADHNHNLNNPHDFQNQVKQGLVLII